MTHLQNRFKTLAVRVLKSKDGKTLVYNFSYLLLLQVAGYLFPLLTMPYLARIIGPDGFGRIAFASAIIIWFQTVVDWGFNYTATRDVAQNREDKDFVSRTFSTVLWARCVLMLIAGILLLILTLLIPVFRENVLIILVTFLMIPGHILFPDWFFQAMERMKYTTILNLIVKFIFTIAVFIFVRDENDYILQPIFTTIGYMVCGLISFYIITVKWGYKLLHPNFLEVRHAIRESFDVFLNNLMPNLYNSFSIILLGQYGGVGANGIFDGGNKVVTIFNQLQSALSRAFFPFLSRRTDKMRLFAKVNIGVALLGSILIFVFAPLIIRILLSPEFDNSVVVLRLLSISIIFLAFNNTYGQNYLIINRHEKDLRDITILASVIGMVMAIPLVKCYSYVGAAITILLSRFLLGMLSYLKYVKFERLGKESL